jgi:hypothetical protein
MNTAINLHNRAIEELGAGRWWIPLLAVFIGGMLTLLGNAYLNYQQSTSQFLLTFAQKNAELALQILQRDPSQTSPQLRAWAIDVLDQASGIPIANSARQELLKAPLPAGRGK